ncbi:MAG: hypothetical protein JXR42_01215 [Gammaproteobacteria bacterium]|nr:hypothetical protein [Gammaproteobacteria bacterium]
MTELGLTIFAKLALFFAPVLPVLGPILIGVGIFAVLSLLVFAAVRVRSRYLAKKYASDEYKDFANGKLEEVENAARIGNVNAKKNVGVARIAIKSGNEKLKARALRSYAVAMQASRVRGNKLSSRVIREAFEAIPPYVEIEEASDMLIPALMVYAELVASRRNFIEAAAFAEKAIEYGLEHNDGEVIEHALAVIIWLFHRNQSTDLAVSKACSFISHENSNIRTLSLTLVKKLLNKRCGFREITTAALDGIDDINDAEILVTRLKVLSGIVVKDEDREEFDGIVVAACTNISHQDSRVREASFDLLMNLFDREQGLNDAVTAVLDDIDEVAGVRVLVTKLNVLREVVLRGVGETEVGDIVAAACTNISHQDSRVREASFDLLMNLFDREQGLNDAVTAALGGIEEVASVNVLVTRLKVLSEVVAKDGDIEDFDGIVAVACANISHQDSRVREASFDLLMNLFDLGQGFNDAVTAALGGIEEVVSVNVLVTRLKVLSEVVAKDTGRTDLDKIVVAACTCITHRDLVVVEAAYELLMSLFGQGHGFERAVESVELAYKRYFGSSIYKGGNLLLSVLTKVIAMGKYPEGRLRQKFDDYMANFSQEYLWKSFWDYGAVLALKLCKIMLDNRQCLDEVEYVISYGPDNFWERSRVADMKDKLAEIKRESGYTGRVQPSSVSKPVSYGDGGRGSSASMTTFSSSDELVETTDGSISDLPQSAHED